MISEEKRVQICTPLVHNHQKYQYISANADNQEFFGRGLNQIC